MRRLTAAGVFLVCIALGVTAAAEDPSDALLQGVSRIAAPGAPGEVVLVGDNAFPVIAGTVDGQAAAVVAAGTFGRGRVVAFGHGGYLSKAALETGDTSRLLVNAIEWSSRQAAGRPIRVEAVGEVADRLREQPDRFSLAEGDQARRPHVIVLDSHRLDEPDIVRLRAHVRDGGGLVVTGLGWGWQQLNPARSLQTEHPGNRLLRPMGLVFGSNIVERDGRGGYAATEAPALLNASRASTHLRDVLRNGGSADDVARLASAVLLRAVRALPPGDDWTASHLRPLTSQYRARFGDPAPSEQQPLSGKDVRGLLGRVLLAVELDRLGHLPPGSRGAHPAAASFPGVASEKAKAIRREMVLSRQRVGWRSTGLYAPPGAVVRVRLAADASTGLKVRVGAHADRLWHLDVWKRAPQVTAEEPLTPGELVTISNPFGGPVYLVIPETLETAASLGVAIEGEFWEMPLYVSGTTDEAAWRREIRHHPAPWAEIDAGTLILTVPSVQVRGLENPEALCAFWRQVMDACADLAGRPRKRGRPERFVTDIQISNGYMHAGYPIMTHLDAAERMVDTDNLSEQGDWGMFHELGHNHQSNDWTPAGTGEVTCNLFTLYVYDTVVGRERPRIGLYGEERVRKIRDHLGAGTPLEKWKDDPFLALLSYMQLQEAFGWEAYRAVFEAYRDLPEAQRPANDQQRWDQWVMRFSRQVGRDLSGFYAAWGIQVSETTRQELSALPTWMPQDWPSLPDRAN